MPLLRPLAVSCLFALAACNSSTPTGSLVATSVIAAGAQGCASGGIEIDIGFDRNHNEILEASEVTTRQFICNGSSAAPLLLKTTALPSGDTACPAGGTRIEAGADTNGDGTLQASEVTQTQLICNGTNGSNGTDGTDGTNGGNGSNGTNGTNGAPGTLLRTTPLAKGPASPCPTGGTRIEAGPDTNGDGTLQTSEVKQTIDICNAPGTLLKLTPLGIGDLDCPAGGVRIDSGPDLDANGALEGTEITQTRRVCNGGSPKLALQLFPYSGFNGGFDAQAMIEGRMIRRVTSGMLESFVSSLGARPIHNEMGFRNGDTIFDFSADIKVVGSSPGGTPPAYVAARIAGEFYNDTFTAPPSRIGDIFVSYQLDSFKNCTASLSRCTNLGCSTGTPIDSVTLATNVDYNLFHTLRLQHDGDKTFTVTFDTLPPKTLTGPARVGPASEDFRFLSTSVIPGGTGDAFMSALFDNVKVADHSYDDFSAPRLDRALWNNQEEVREIANGALRLSGNGTELDLTNAATYNAIAADVRISEFESSGALDLVGVGGAFYNDGNSSGGAGSQAGDVSAFVVMNDTQAFYAVLRCKDFECDDADFLTNETTLHGLPVNLLGPVTLGSTHTLFVQFDGARFTLQLDGEAPVHFDPVAAGAPVAQGFPNFPLMQLFSDVETDAGQSGYVTGIFDNLRVGSRTLAGP